MPGPSQHITITVAIIGVAGTLGAALISNWDKVFGHPSPSAVTTAKLKAVPASEAEETPEPIRQSRKHAATIPDIGGIWRDAQNPSIGSKVVQEGPAFQILRWGVLPDGTQFQSSGSGTLNGRQMSSYYNTRYANGTASAGECSGTVSTDVARIDLSCRDSMFGTFAVMAIR